MLKNKHSNQNSNPIVINGICMKPDWKTTLLTMKVGEQKRFDRSMTTVSRIRVRVAKLNSETNLQFTANTFDNDEYCIVTRIK